MECQARCRAGAERRCGARPAQGALRIWPGRRRSGLLPMTALLTANQRGHSRAISTSVASGPRCLAAIVHRESPDLTTSSRRDGSSFAALAGADVTNLGAGTGGLACHCGRTSDVPATTGPVARPSCAGSVANARLTGDRTGLSAHWSWVGAHAADSATVWLGTSPGPCEASAWARGAATSCIPSTPRASRRMNAGLRRPADGSGAPPAGPFQ